MISKKELLFQSRYLCTAPNFLEKLHFGKSKLLTKAIFCMDCFLWRLPFQNGYFFKRRYLLQQLPSQKSYFLQHNFLKDLLFHSYAFFPQLHFLFILIYSVPVTCKLSVGVFSCVSVIVKSCFIMAKQSYTNLAKQSHFLIRLLFPSFHVLKIPAFFKEVTRFRKNCFSKRCFFQNS